jgi:hypothetical protein
MEMSKNSPTSICSSKNFFGSRYNGGQGTGARDGREGQVRWEKKREKGKEKGGGRRVNPPNTKT